MERNCETHGADSPPSRAVRSPQYGGSLSPVRGNDLPCTRKRPSLYGQTAWKQPIQLLKTTFLLSAHNRAPFPELLAVASGRNRSCFYQLSLLFPRAEGSLSLHGGCLLPTRRVGSPYTEGFDFPARSKTPLRRRLELWERNSPKTSAKSRGTCE